MNFVRGLKKGNYLFYLNIIFVHSSTIRLLINNKDYNNGFKQQQKKKKVFFGSYHHHGYRTLSSFWEDFVLFFALLLKAIHDLLINCTLISSQLLSVGYILY